jgi:hypothetical protein
VNGGHEWMAQQLVAMAHEFDFDGFIARALRLIPTDEDVNAVLQALDSDSRSTADGAALAARRLRLAQYAGAWLAAPKAIARQDCADA